MIRLPDRVFVVIERVYREQYRMRRAELRAAVEKEDRDMRAYYARLAVRHEAGTCGGAEAGCCYVPCVPKVSSW
jgi:hypothetical protein